MRQPVAPRRPSVNTHLKTTTYPPHTSLIKYGKDTITQPFSLVNLLFKREKSATTSPCVKFIHMISRIRVILDNTTGKSGSNGATINNPGLK